MEKLNITEGEWKLVLGKKDQYQFMIFANNLLIIKWSNKGLHNENLPLKEAKSNAKLIADAGTTYNQCQILPSELLKQRNELLEALKSTNQLNLHLYKEGTIGSEVYKEIQAAIKNAQP